MVLGFGKAARKSVMLPLSPGTSDDGKTLFPLSLVQEIHDVSGTGTYYLKIDNNAGTSYYIKTANSPDVLDNAGEQYAIERAFITSGDYNVTAKRIHEAKKTMDEKKDVALYESKPDDKVTLAPVAILLAHTHYKEMSAEEFAQDYAAINQMSPIATLLGTPPRSRDRSLDPDAAPV